MANLLLIPTSYERDWIISSLRRRDADAPRAAADGTQWELEIIGFGLVAAGIATAGAIMRHRPQRVLLLGIAGSYDERLAIGSACSFDRVTCHGIGIGGEGDDTYRSAGELGWAQCEASATQFAIGDTIEMADDPSHTVVRDSSQRAATPQHLLSVASASANEAQATRRRHHFPTAVAEDMEGYAVAMACQLANVPLQIIRGISNRAGDRDHAHWQVEKALNSAIELVSRQPGVTFDL